jgi:hypothetical protein
MITKEQYEYYQQFRAVLELFNKSGEYIGGCNDLFSYMKIEDTRCPSCVGAALITAYTQIKQYESNL